MSEVHIVVLAAGRGTRMKSARPKVLHHIAGAPMIDYVLRAAAELQPHSLTIVIGHQGHLVQTALADRPGLRFVVQEPQLGTAHALLKTESVLRDERGTVVLLSGDVPLLTPGTLERLIARHTTTGAAASVVTAVVEQPFGYGRIVRRADRIEHIVEEKDATAEERAIREINSGIYAFALDGLFDALRQITTDNVQREHYLPDLITIVRSQGRNVEAVTVGDPDEVRGINSLAELAEASRTIHDATAAMLMSTGVVLDDPATTFVDRDVEIGADTIVHPGVSIQGRTVIGRGCEIHSGVRIVDSRLADDVTILDHCVIVGAVIGSGAQVGPFAHLRPASELGERSRVGNFVEMKKAALGAGSKAMHLSYLGDASIGAHVNIGAGTITCNYDGVRKQVTTIEDGAFIGSDTQLIAPVTVGRDAYVGTGTTVREDVPAGALAVSAGKQRNIEGWAEQRRKKQG